MATQMITSTTRDATAAVGVFERHESAEAAVRQLAAARFDITKISVVGRGFHTEDAVTGFYNAGNRIGYWGRSGAIWGGLWGLLLGGAFMIVPALGPIVVAGHLAVALAAAAEGAVVVGGFSALGAALYGFGIPEDTVLRYEKAIQADRYLVVVHGDPVEVERARGILQQSRPDSIDVHANVVPA